MAYVEKESELHEVIGSSFEALAQDSASKIDRECERAIARDRLVVARERQPIGSPVVSSAPRVCGCQQMWRPYAVSMR